MKSVFIDNVRDYQGSNTVNIDIAATISDGFMDQFSLRNNGVTIVTRDLNITGYNFTLRDYQIVNGCQTSHVLYSEKERKLPIVSSVPVKLVFTDDEEIAQDVTKSTNRQTPLEESDLLALTKFQRDLESYYGGFDGEKKLYYERRSKQHANTGVDRVKIVPIGI